MPHRWRHAKMTKVSVIIPLFNSASFLESLFDNLQRQTISASLQFVFIDDHGSDDSVERAHALAESSGLDCVFGATAVNGGPGAARNAGLALAKGEYVAFVDSDDALDPAFCEKLYDAAAAYDADIAYCHILFIQGDNRQVRRNPMVSSGGFTRGNKVRYLKKYQSYFTTYIYKRSFLAENGIRFPMTRSAEDSCFLAQALLCAGRVATVDEPLYHYRQHNDSLSKRRDRGRSRQRMASFKALISFAKEKGLYRDYKCVLDWIFFKKAILGSIRDRLGI